MGYQRHYVFIDCTHPEGSGRFGPACGSRERCCICSCLPSCFRMAALSCYLTRKVRDQFNQRDWEEAWKLLTRVVLGSHWTRKHGGKYAGGDPPTILPIECPAPVHIPEAVEEYERYQSSNLKDADARDNYSLLCDFAHANAACLLGYHKYEENGALIRFSDPDLDPQANSFLPFVNSCLVDLLTFGYELLGLANEKEVRAMILVARQELVRLALPA
jgi:hypothetical protein